MSHLWEAVALFEKGGQYVVSLIRRFTKALLPYFKGEVYTASGVDWETEQWFIPRTVYASSDIPRDAHELLQSNDFLIIEEEDLLYQVSPPPGVRREKRGEFVWYYRGSTLLFWHPI